MNHWNYYMQQLYQRMEEQDRRLKNLETKLEQFEKNQSKNTVEKVEYKFDQLKIENLEGTLHIGLTPNDMKGIEDFSVPAGQKSFKDKLTADLNGYLKENGENIIHNIAEQHQFSLKNVTPTVLIDDMLKQIPERIAFHEKEAMRNQANLTEEQMYQHISDQIKNEINHSLYTFMERNEQHD